MVPVFPNSFYLIGLFRVSVFDFVLFGEFLVFVDGVDEFLLDFLYFLKEEVVFFLEFQPLVLRVHVFELL